VLLAAVELAGRSPAIDQGRGPRARRDRDRRRARRAQSEDLARRRDRRRTAAIAAAAIASRVDVLSLSCASAYGAVESRGSAGREVDHNVVLLILAHRCDLFRASSTAHLRITAWR
jgi:hypothetical protein